MPATVTERVPFAACSVVYVVVGVVGWEPRTNMYTAAPIATSTTSAIQPR